jgi:hypothetical protein
MNAPANRAPAWVTLGIVAVIGLACFNMAFVLREGLALSVATAAQAVLAANFLTGVAMLPSLGWMAAVALLLFRHPDRYRMSTAHA